MSSGPFEEVFAIAGATYTSNTWKQFMRIIPADRYTYLRLTVSRWRAASRPPPSGEWLRGWQWLSVPTKARRGSPSRPPRAKALRPFSAFLLRAIRRCDILHHWGSETLAPPLSVPNNGSGRSSDGLSCSDTGRAAREHRSRVSRASSKGWRRNYSELSYFPQINHSKNHFYFEMMKKDFKIASDEWFIPIGWDRGSLESVYEEKDSALELANGIITGCLQNGTVIERCGDPELR